MTLLRRVFDRTRTRGALPLSIALALALSAPVAAHHTRRSTSSADAQSKAKRAKSRAAKARAAKRARSRNAHAPKTKAKRTRTKRASRTDKKKRAAKARAQRARPQKSKAKRSATKRALTKRKTTKKSRTRSTTARSVARKKAENAKANRRSQPKRTRTKVASRSPSASDSRGLVAKANRYLGARYRMGGRGNDGSFDCSGLVSRVYADAGIEIPRTATAQANAGRSIPLADARPGDVVFFGSPIHHTGIVVSNAAGALVMVHASSSQGVIRTTVTGSQYWGPRLRGARRY